MLNIPKNLICTWKMAGFTPTYVRMYIRNHDTPNLEHVNHEFCIYHAVHTFGFTVNPPQYSEPS